MSQCLSTSCCQLTNVAKSRGNNLFRLPVHPYETGNCTFQLRATGRSGVRGQIPSPSARTVARWRRGSYVNHLASVALDTDSEVSTGSDNAELPMTQTLESTLQEFSEDIGMSATQYSPAGGVEAFEFYGICVVLILAFWIGNWLAPYFIFRNSVFRGNDGKVNEADDGFPPEAEEIQSKGVVPEVEETESRSKTFRNSGFGKTKLKKSQVSK